MSNFFRMSTYDKLATKKMEFNFLVCVKDTVSKITLICVASYSCIELREIFGP